MNGIDLSVVLASGLALGAAYGLIGAGVATVAMATRTLHLAVGQVLVAGVLIRLVVGVEAVTRVPPLAAVAIGVGAGAALSALLEPLVLGRLRPGLAWLVGLVVAGGVFEAIIARTLGTRTLRPVTLVAAFDRVTVAGIGGEVVVAVALGVPLALLLALATTRLRWGQRLRLLGASTAAAERGGIVPSTTRAGALAVSGAVTVLAGLLVAPITFAGVGQAAALTVRGVAAAALLGRGNPAWAVPGGIALGLAEATAASLWPEAGGEVAVAVVIVVVLATRGSDRLQAWGRAW